MGEGPKTVLFAQHYSDGGSITGLLDLIRSLDPARYRSVVAFERHSPFEAEVAALGALVVVLDPRSTEEAPAGVPAVRTGPRSRPLRRELGRVRSRDLPGSRRVAAVIREHGVDLVHGNNDTSSNRDAVIACLRTRTPMVVHVRWLMDYRGDAKQRIDGFLARRAAHVFYMSKAIEATYAPLRIAPGRGSVIDDPFHAEDYAVAAPEGIDASLGVAPEHRLVTVLGRLIRWKGQDVFLRAMAPVLHARPDVRAVLVGTATEPAGEAFAEQLHALADELGIADRVVFAGMRRDVPELIARSSVMVHCSTEPEPFGRVVVEGQAGARPTIGVRAGGVPEIIEDGVTGLLTELGDPASLQAAVERLLDDPEAARAMGERAQAAVRDRFSIERHGAAVMAVYDRILGR